MASALGGCGESLTARAKINLSLHVVGRRADGYHLLDGLTVFAETGDRLEFREADEDGLTIVGPMAGALSAGGNILHAALRVSREVAAAAGVSIPPLSVTLEKNLPVASGLGGGSADAAALLAFLAARHPVLREPLAREAVRLGADVPMCLFGRPCRIGGIGEVLAPLPAFPTLPILLVNPGVAVSTADVFARLDPAAMQAPAASAFEEMADIHAVAEALRGERNDLEGPAIALAPAIGEAKALVKETGALFVRMSGSGASVFGIYPDDDAAASAAAALSAERPAWWVAATRSFGT